MSCWQTNLTLCVRVAGRDSEGAWLSGWVLRGGTVFCLGTAILRSKPSSDAHSEQCLIQLPFLSPVSARPGLVVPAWGFQRRVSKCGLQQGAPRKDFRHCDRRRHLGGISHCHVPPPACSASPEFTLADVGSAGIMELGQSGG